MFISAATIAILTSVAVYAVAVAAVIGAVVGATTAATVVSVSVVCAAVVSTIIAVAATAAMCPTSLPPTCPSFVCVHPVLNLSSDYDTSTCNRIISILIIIVSAYLPVKQKNS